MSEFWRPWTPPPITTTTTTSPPPLNNTNMYIDPNPSPLGSYALGVSLLVCLFMFAFLCCLCIRRCRREANKKKGRVQNAADLEDCVSL